jgi:transcription initiation factor TFIIIB Brf1 subunit/transcription initiation factor TFIIB
MGQAKDKEKNFEKYVQRFKKKLPITYSIQTKANKLCLI